MIPFKLHIPAYVSLQGIEWAKEWQERGEEWIAKMLRYYEQEGAARIMAVSRIVALLNDDSFDWDDNVAESWAKQLAEYLKIEAGKEYVYVDRSKRLHLTGFA